MKSYLPMAIAGALVILGLAAVLFITPALAPPEARLHDQIADKVAAAEAMLASYNPVDAEVLEHFAASQPSSPESTEHWGNLNPTLSDRRKLIDTALATIKEALSESIEAGDTTVRGDNDPAATRLAAILQIEKGRLLGREAQARWREAARARDRLRDHLAAWKLLKAQVESTQDRLAGQGDLPNAGAGAAADPAGASAGATSGSDGTDTKVGQLIGRLLHPRGKKPSTPKPAAPKVEQAKAAPAPQPAVVARPATRPALPADCTLDMTADQFRARQTQSPMQRAADLQVCRQEVLARIADASKKADALAPRIADLQKRIDAAKAEADAAHQKMAQLEQAGVDATDAQSLPRYTKDYTDASQAYRKAIRSLSILTSGAIAEAKLTPEEAELLAGPPIDIESGLAGDQRGIVALQTDFDSAKALAAAQQKLLGMIDEQIKDLSARQKLLETQLAQQKTALATIQQHVAAEAQTAFAEATRGWQLQTEALQVLQNDATAAATRAESAARAVASDASSKLGEFPESQRYAMLSKDKTTGGHAKTLHADAELAAAMVLAQQVEQLTLHAKLLDELAPTGIAMASLVPKELSEAPGEWLTSTAGAEKAIATSREAAIKSGKAAIEGYQEAGNDLENLWTLQAQAAAANYVLANVTTGDDSANYAKEARRRFSLATRDRADRPEVQAMRPAFESVTTQPG